MLGHWSSLAGAVSPPAWSGPVRVHRLPDDDPTPELAPPRAKPGPIKGSKPSPKGTRKPRVSQSKQARELRQLQRRAQESVLQVLPAWTLIRPGSPGESLMQKAPASWWWPLHPSDERYAPGHSDAEVPPQTRDAADRAPCQVGAVRAGAIRPGQVGDLTEARP